MRAWMMLMVPLAVGCGGGDEKSGGDTGSAANGDGDGDGDADADTDADADVDVDSIRLEPTSATLTTDGSTPGSVTFVVCATTNAGEDVVSGPVDWILSNTEAGSITDSGTFESATLNRGVTTIV
jgi:hypothetical protein